MESKKLIKGKVYFQCRYYYHTEYWIPEIRTLVFIEMKTVDSEKVFVFNDPEYYFGIKPDSKVDRCMPERSLNSIYDIQGLNSFVESVKKCRNANKIFDLKTEKKKGE